MWEGRAHVAEQEVEALQAGMEGLEAGYRDLQESVFTEVEWIKLRVMRTSGLDKTAATHIDALLARLRPLPVE